LIGHLQLRPVAARPLCTESLPGGGPGRRVHDRTAFSCSVLEREQVRYLGALPSFIDGLLITRMISKMISKMISPAILSHDLQQVYSPYQEFFSNYSGRSMTRLCKRLKQFTAE
jgi:hypothetical protein